MGASGRGDPTPVPIPDDDGRIDRLLRILACPACRCGELRVRAERLACAGCGREVALRGGVPDFTDGGGPGGSFEFQWEERREGRFESDTLYGKTAEYEERQFFACLGLDPAGGRRLVLDAGCGSGRLVALLARRDLDVVGVDITSSVVEIDRAMRAERRDNVVLVQGDLLRIPLKDDQFDAVWSGGVIHHTGDAHAAFRGLVRVLKPGGTLFVWVYSVDQGIFGRVRQLLPWAHRLPHRPLLALCRLLAVPVWLLGVAAHRPHPMREVVFKLFDHLGPRYRSVHGEAELAGWFRAEGLEGIEVLIPQRTGGVGIRGVKPARPA